MAHATPKVRDYKSTESWGTLMANDPSTRNDLAWLDACDQAELVRSGQTSPRELVDAAIERIERVNPQINAVIHERFDQARAEADGELSDGPFRGVPLLLKDFNARSKGDPYHVGSRFLKRLGHRVDHDSTLVSKLRRAGFVIVGRTNVAELCTTITTEPVAYGPTRNPWSLDHSSGGSSGGSSAAVAAGLTPVAHGEDGGGSIRVPASECGLVGLKPSRGRVSQGPDAGERWMGAAMDGCLTRTVRDTAAVLDCMAGYVPGDPYTAPPPVRPYADEVRVGPGRLRVGLLDRPVPPNTGVHPECEAAVAGAGNLLEGLGHTVEADRPSALGDPAFTEHYVNMVAANTAALVDTWGSISGQGVPDDELEPDNVGLVAMGRALSATQYLASVEWLHGYGRRIAAWWSDEGFDLLLTPVIPTPPPKIGWLRDPDEGFPRLIELLQYTPHFNATGQPAISLPLHWTGDGLPVGVQLVAAYGREDLLLRVAAQLEQAHPWSGRRPPIHA